MAVWLRLVLLGSFLACVGLAYLGMGPVGQAMVIGNSRDCYYRLYNGVSPEARVLITGSSRIRRAVLPRDVAAALDLPEKAVVNLAHPGASLQFDYALMDRLTAEGDVDLVIAGLWPQGTALRAEEAAADRRTVFLARRI